MSSLFAIIHVDFWIPGKYTDSKSNIVLMNVMCDMSGFVVVALVTKDYSATLADSFFYTVLMKFDLCRLIVIDGITPFKDFLLPSAKLLV